MMTVSLHVEALLDRDVRSLTAVEWRVVAEAFPDEYVRLVVRLEARSDADARTRTSGARRHRLLAARLAASIPFQPLNP